jgi:hypothetical protein
MSQETVLREFRDRRNRERAKAIKKYALVALLPGGDPERDVFDYGINELVGMPRYAEMMESRIRGFALPETLEDEALAVCRQIAALTRLAIDLIDIRQKLLRRGISLGKPEAA